jgi:hypothetical protein
MAEIPSRRRRWVLPAALVVVGVLMVVVGSFRQGDYASQLLLQVGSAFALFGPLYWAQWMLERGITEVRDQERKTQSSVQELSREVEAIREETVATLDDLREAALGHVRQRRRTDEDAFRRFLEDPTFENVTGLLDRARQLGGVSRRGVRVRLPGTSLRLRFPVPEPGDGVPPVLEVGLEEEDGTRPQGGAAPRVPVRGQVPVPWSAGQSAGEWAASMAGELQALNRYPGDDHFDPSGALEQLTSLLRLAIEARTRPPTENGSMPRLRPIIEVPNDEWAITEDGLQSLHSGDAFTVKELFSATTEEAAGARLQGEGAVKLREAWRLGQRLFLSPGTAL